MIQAFRRHLLDRFVLRPSRNVLEYAPKERVLMRIDGATDEYFRERPRLVDDPSRHQKPPALLVIKFPGTAGRAERSSAWPSEFLSDVDALICTWNAPGYGRSSGRATLSNIARRAARFTKHLIDQYAAPGQTVWLSGNSLGCATATFLAAEHDFGIDGLILRNPPPLVETVKRVARRYPLGHLTDAIAESLPTQMNLSVTAPRVTVPTVLFQSEHDQLVPPSLQEDVFEALSGPKRLVVLKGIGHDGIATEQHEGDIASAVQWLWSQTRRPT